MNKLVVDVGYFSTRCNVFPCLFAVYVFVNVIQSDSEYLTLDLPTHFIHCIFCLACMQSFKKVGGWFRLSLVNSGREYKFFG